MKWKALTLVAVVAGVAGPSIADACEWGPNRQYLRAGGTSLALSVLTPTDDLFGSMVVAGTLGLGLGDRFVIAPSVGMCMIGADGGGEDFSEVMFGGTAAFQVVGSSDSKFKLNAQAGVSIMSYSGVTETNIPIQAAAQVAASEKAAIYFGGGIVMSKFKTDLVDFSENDPVLFGGINLMLGRLTLSGGLGARLADDTDLDLTIALKLPLGGG